MKTSRTWSWSFILFSSSCHMSVSTEVLEESALLSPPPGHPFYLQPPLPIRKGVQGNPGWWQSARHSQLAGKFDVAALTYCPCGYPAYAREKSFVNKCEELDSKNFRLHCSASNTIIGHWFSIGSQKWRLPWVLNYHVPRAIFGILPRLLTKSSMLHLWDLTLSQTPAI